MRHGLLPFRLEKKFSPELRGVPVNVSEFTIDPLRASLGIEDDNVSDDSLFMPNMLTCKRGYGLGANNVLLCCSKRGPNR